MFTVLAIFVALLGACFADDAPAGYKPSAYKTPTYEDAPAKYNFDWSVKDDPSYNNFGQTENRDGYNTDGSYFVLLPDGRTQNVKYYVNGDSGYVAEVTYSGEAKYDASYKKSVYAPAPASYKADEYKPTPAAYKTEEYKQTTEAYEPEYKAAPSYQAPTYNKPAAYKAPASSYKPAPAAYNAPVSSYKPAPAAYKAPVNNYDPAPAAYKAPSYSAPAPY